MYFWLPLDFGGEGPGPPAPPWLRPLLVLLKNEEEIGALRGT